MEPEDEGEEEEEEEAAEKADEVEVDATPSAIAAVDDALGYPIVDDNSPSGSQTEFEADAKEDETLLVEDGEEVEMDDALGYPIVVDDALGYPIVADDTAADESASSKKKKKKKKKGKRKNSKQKEINKTGSFSRSLLQSR